MPQCCRGCRQRVEEVGTGAQMVAAQHRSTQGEHRRMLSAGDWRRQIGRCTGSATQGGTIVPPPNRQRRQRFSLLVLSSIVLGLVLKNVLRTTSKDYL